MEHDPKTTSAQVTAVGAGTGAARPDDSVERRGDAESFDGLLERLRGVVEKLETGSLGLEDSLAAFEEGVGLSRRGAAILDAAERRVDMLVRGADGTDKVVPFAGEGEGGAR